MRSRRFCTRSYYCTYRVGFRRKAKRLPHFFTTFYPRFPEFIAQTLELWRRKSRLNLPGADRSYMPVPGGLFGRSGKKGLSRNEAAHGEGEQIFVSRLDATKENSINIL